MCTEVVADDNYDVVTIYAHMNRENLTDYVDTFDFFLVKKPEWITPDNNLLSTLTTDGAVASVYDFTSGSSLTNGTYIDITTTTNGSGTGLKLNAIVSGGALTTCGLANALDYSGVHGTGYEVGDEVYLPSGTLGGSSTQSTVKVWRNYHPDWIEPGPNVWGTGNFNMGDATQVTNEEYTGSAWIGSGWSYRPIMFGWTHASGTLAEDLGWPGNAGSTFNYTPGLPNLMFWSGHEDSTSTKAIGQEITISEAGTYEVRAIYNFMTTIRAIGSLGSAGDPTFTFGIRIMETDGTTLYNQVFTTGSITARGFSSNEINQTSGSASSCGVVYETVTFGSGDTGDYLFQLTASHNTVFDGTWNTAVWGRVMGLSMINVDEITPSTTVTALNTDNWHVGPPLLDRPPDKSEPHDATSFVQEGGYQTLYNRYGHHLFGIAHEFWGAHSGTATVTSQVDSTLLFMAEEINIDGGGGWDAGSYVVGMSYYDDDRQESNMTVNWDEFTDPFVISADNMQVRINVLINVYDVGNSDPGGTVPPFDYWRRMLSEGMRGVRFYMSEVGSGEWYYMADIDFEDGIAWPGVDPIARHQYKRIWENVAHSDDDPATIVGIVSSEFAEDGVVYDIPPSVTREALTGKTGDEKSFFRYRTAVVSNRRAFIGNLISMNEKQEVIGAYGDRILKSNRGQYDFFPENSYIDVGINDGDEIVKLEAFADRILDFKRKVLYVINISKEYESLEDTFVGKGIKHQTQSCHTPYGITFLNESGCYLYGEGLNSLTQDRISDTDWSDFIGVHPSISFDPIKGQIICIDDITDLSAADVLVFDFKTTSWFKGTDRLTEGFAASNVSMSAGGEIQYFVNNKLYKWDRTPTTGVATLLSKDIDFGNPSVTSKIHSVYINYKNGSGSLAPTYGVDGGSPSQAFDVNYLTDTSGNFITVRLKLQGIKKGKTFQLKLTGTIPNGFEINDFSVVHTTKSIK
jgi:hypothetical protein